MPKELPLCKRTFNWRGELGELGVDWDDQDYGSTNLDITRPGNMKSLGDIFIWQGLEF